MPENYFSNQDQFPDSAGQLYPGAVCQTTLGRFTAQTFLLMAAGLAISFFLGFFFSQTFTGVILLLQALDAVPWLFVALPIAELVVVIAMTALLRKMSPAAAWVCFFVYAVLTGLTFSVIFLVYELSSLVLVFGFTALYFVGMAVFGYLTNLDLSRIRNILLGGLVAVVAVNLLMLLIPGLEVMDRVLCTVGVVIFLAYTAYDTQKIKSFYYSFQGDDAMLKKACVISALELYLDFVNLFLYLLRLFGKRRD